MLQVKASEFRKTVDELAKGKNHDSIFNYLRTLGMVVNARDGLLNIDNDCIDKLKFMVSEVEQGDIVWVPNHGMMLIVDKHPKVNDDGHHFRSLKVTTSEDGSYRILGEFRSIIIDDSEAFRIKHTSFDMVKIESLSYERYTAHTRIVQINDELSNMKETDNG